MMMRSEIKDHFRAPLKHHTKDKIKQKNNCEEALEKVFHQACTLKSRLNEELCKRNLK